MRGLVEAGENIIHQETPIGREHAGQALCAARRHHSTQAMITKDENLFIKAVDQGLEFGHKRQFYEHIFILRRGRSYNGSTSPLSLARARVTLLQKITTFLAAART